MQRIMVYIWIVIVAGLCGWIFAERTAPEVVYAPATIETVVPAPKVDIWLDAGPPEQSTGTWPVARVV